MRTVCCYGADRRKNLKTTNSSGDHISWQKRNWTALSNCTIVETTTPHILCNDPNTYKIIFAVFEQHKTQTLSTVTLYFLSLSFSFSLSPTFSPTTFFIAVSHRPIPDLDCKLKSAAQTPAAMHNNLHNNVPEILGRSSVNSSQMYYKTVSAHFASCIIILIFKIVSQSLRSEFRLILWILYGALSAHSRTFLYSVLTLFALSLILTVGRSMVRWTLNTPYKHTYFRVYFVYARFTMLFFFLHEMYTRGNSQGKASDCGREYEREWSEKRKGTMWK